MGSLKMNTSYFVQKYFGDKKMTPADLVTETLYILCPSFLRYVHSDRDRIIFNNYLCIPNTEPSLPLYTHELVPDALASLARALFLYYVLDSRQIVFYYSEPLDIDLELVKELGDRFKVVKVEDFTQFRHDTPTPAGTSIYYVHTTAVYLGAKIGKTEGSMAKTIAEHHLKDELKSLDFWKRAEAVCEHDMSPYRRTGITTLKIIQALYLAITNPQLKIALAVRSHDMRNEIWSRFSQTPKPKNLDIINLRERLPSGKDYDYIVIDPDLVEFEKYLLSENTPYPRLLNQKARILL